MRIESGPHFVSEEDRTFFADLAEVLIMQSDEFIQKMTTDNFDLSMVMEPSCDPIKFIFAGKLFKAVIYADDIKDISGDIPLPAFYVQVWHEDKSIIIANQFRNDCNINWRDEKMELSNLAKALTTLMLDADEESDPAIKTMCTVIAAKLHISGFYRVMDKGEANETCQNVNR